jgi:hypothetical protein
VARYQCERRACREIVHTTDPPHLCKDLRQRLARQQQALALIMPILAPFVERTGDTEEVALRVIKALAGRDLGA